MNIDLAIHSNIQKDLDELDANIQKTFNKLVELTHEKEKLLLYNLVSHINKPNGPVYINQESPSIRPVGSEDINNQRIP